MPTGDARPWTESLHLRGYFGVKGVAAEESVAVIGGLPNGYVKVRPCRNGLAGFVAWGSLAMLKTDTPIDEPSDPVHFYIAETSETAIDRLTSEMDSAYGKHRWTIQP